VALRTGTSSTAWCLVSSTAGLADAAQRAARRRSDGELARTIEEHGVGVFLERWLAQPMFASVPPDAPGLAERRSMAPERLAHQLRALGQGAQPSLWERLSELSGLDRPVVLVAAAADAKYRAVAAEMARRIPGSLRVSVPGGHAVPLEAPAALAAEVSGRGSASPVRHGALRVAREEVGRGHHGAHVERAVDGPERFGGHVRRRGGRGSPAPRRTAAQGARAGSAAPAARPTDVSIMEVTSAGVPASSATARAALTPPSGWTLRPPRRPPPARRTRRASSGPRTASSGGTGTPTRAPDQGEVGGRRRLLDQLESVALHPPDRAHRGFEFPCTVGVGAQGDRRAHCAAGRGDSLDVVVGVAASTP